MYTTTHLSTCAWWVVRGLEQRLSRAHAGRAYPDGRDGQTTHWLWGLGWCPQALWSLASFLVNTDNSNPLPYRSLRGVNGSKHMKVIYKLGSSRKCQSCCDVFIFSQLLICHIEFIYVTLSCFSWVPASCPWVNPSDTLPVCVFIHTPTHSPLHLLTSYPPTSSPTLPSTHPPTSSSDPCCVPGTNEDPDNEDISERPQFRWGWL